MYSYTGQYCKGYISCTSRKIARERNFLDTALWLLIQILLMRITIPISDNANFFELFFALKIDWQVAKLHATKETPPICKVSKRALFFRMTYNLGTTRPFSFYYTWQFPIICSPGEVDRTKGSKYKKRAKFKCVLYINFNTRLNLQQS